MLQLLQSLKDGSLELVDVPAPVLQPGTVRVRVLASAVSPGTERLIAGLARKSLLAKARARPDQVRKVLDKVKRDGVLAAYRAVQSKLSDPAPVGYSCAGRVLEAGEGCEDLAPGMLVACAGAGYANHAEEVVVPRNLAIPVPEGLTPDEAAFVALGAIALQGVRVARVELGETVAVVGLGLLGLLTVQLLKASGCRVLGTDPRPDRVELAKRVGADAAWATGEEALPDRFLDATASFGVDAVLVTASAETNAPMVLSGEISRDRGRVVVVGAVNTEFSRDAYFAKELEVRLSRSYGPGRYDPLFEEHGVEYPRGYVRFSETENMRTFLDLVAQERVDVEGLVTHRFPIASALQAYETLMGGEPSLGILLTYPPRAQPVAAPPAVAIPRRSRAGQVGVSFVGAGQFARSVLIPQFAGQSRLRRVVTRGGRSAQQLAQGAGGFEEAVDDVQAVLDDAETELVVVATRHDSHAELVARALEAGKHVFCEKPLAVALDGLVRVEQALAASGRLLHVGFNRRFAPLVGELARLRRDSAGPTALHVRVNAGPLPGDHWALGPEGGGRLLGEGCHFVDLVRFLVGRPIVAVSGQAVAGHGLPGALGNFSVSFRFADGSLATLLYTSLGDSSSGKEYVELFAGGASGTLDDYRSLNVVRGGRAKKSRSLSKDKGHARQVNAVLRAVRQGGAPPIPPEQVFEVSLATLAVQSAIRQGRTLTAEAWRGALAEGTPSEEPEPKSAGAP
jgi:predicted dehydrogenase